MITFSDRALVRSLGTDDPEALSAAMVELSNTDDDYVWRYSAESEGDDEDMEFVPVEQEIERLLSRYDCRGNLRRAP